MLAIAPGRERTLFGIEGDERDPPQAARHGGDERRSIGFFGGYESGGGTQRQTHFGELHVGNFVIQGYAGGFLPERRVGGAFHLGGDEAFDAAHPLEGDGFFRIDRRRQEWF